MAISNLTIIHGLIKFIFLNGCHVEYNVGILDTILSEDHTSTFSVKFGDGN
jgi:hypothetical protein